MVISQWCLSMQSRAGKGKPPVRFFADDLGRAPVRQDRAVYRPGALLDGARKAIIQQLQDQLE
jgi:hypothetical protein